MNQQDSIARVNQSETNQIKSRGLTPVDRTSSLPSTESCIFQKGNLSFSLDFEVESDRVIKGIAHFPKVDRERELILIKAFEDALPNFMKHPILHVNHSERPAGIVNEAKITEDGLFLKASIFDDPGSDDIWKAIEAKRLHKFSIYGKRLEGTTECKLHPAARTSPCITKAIELWSVSLVGDNAVNDATFFDIVKSFQVETEDKFIKGETEKFIDMDNSDNDVEVKCNDSVGTYEKADLEVSEGNTSAILSRLKKVEEALNKLVESDKNVHASMGDTMDKATEGAEQVAQPEAPITKAEPEKTDSSDELKKAFMDEVSTIKKAMDEKFVALEGSITEVKKAMDTLKAMEERIAKVENETIIKGGNVVVVNGEIKDALSTPVELSDRLSNLEALKGV